MMSQIKKKGPGRKLKTVIRLGGKGNAYEYNANNEYDGEIQKLVDALKAFRYLYNTIIYTFS